MKIFGKRLFVLLFSLLIVVTILNIAVGKKNKIPRYYQLHYDEFSSNAEEHNGIILGSSHATHGIRPSYINFPDLTFYNFALNGSGPEFYYKWYNDIFKKMYKKPDYIIFCVEWFLFDPSWLYRRYEHDAEYFPLDIFINNLFNLKDIDTKTLILNRFPFIKHNRRKDLELLFDENLQTDSLFLMKEYDRGFIPFEDNNPELNNPNKEVISPKQKKYFELLLDGWKNDSIKVVLVHMPEYAPLSNYTEHASDSIFTIYSEKYDIPYLNYNIEKRSHINSDIELYSDWGHLNSIGSMIFSKLLRRDLDNIIIQ